ncbi:unnamed protein product [Schistosoma margrebowiei]|uniref:Phospholipid/glycerol acyltransferase domain-containing protein n=1 Tax=Schistosoma margrebowiei TaxID=48269 RepID=A0A3P7YSC3_9TREM|nr:unnamed protein product [Schistosoma margrebowiei]
MNRPLHLCANVVWQLELMYVRTYEVLRLFMFVLSFKLHSLFFSFIQVGQKHGGFFGFAERVISCAVPAVWFDREEILDRLSTAKRLKDHAATPNAEPILIFPEGTCINNTSVMKFKKGCFEVGAEIHPVAIRYNPLFADCFWNSSLDSLFQYSLKIMTSWAIMVDVWYLPPTRKSDQEDSIAFARRVQYSIAQCGVVDRISFLFLILTLPLYHRLISNFPTSLSDFISHVLCQDVIDKKPRFRISWNSSAKSTCNLRGANAVYATGALITLA